MLRPDFSIVLLGTGNVAHSLIPLLKPHIVQLYAHTASHATEFGIPYTTDLNALVQDADVYLYALKDDALSQVISQVHTPPTTWHIHTSGSMGLTVFGEDKPHCGVVYPLHSFTITQPLTDWTNTPVFILSNEAADIQTVVQQFVPQTYIVSQKDLDYLHIAGVFANNFTNLMYTLAHEVLSTHTTIPFDVLIPFILSTAQKVCTSSPRTLQTGPAVRGDTAVIAQETILLRDETITQRVYTLLSEIIQQMYHHE